MKKFLAFFSAMSLLLGLTVAPAFADSYSTGFENPPFTVGSINGQDGWTMTGSYDAAIVANTYNYSSFDNQSLRISNAVTSGSFGDQVFAKPLINGVGESDSTAGTFATGTRQTHFEVQFDIASTVPTAQQPGLSMSTSPDRGDGSRMSYLRFDDEANGIHVFFDDVTDAGPVGATATFNESDIATLDRTVPHTIKLTLDTLEGPSNDVVNVYIDGVLKKTGTSWEDYYRYDPEASAEQSPRIVTTELFRESGTANTDNIGKGFLIDNFSMMSGTPTVTVTIAKYLDGIPATSTLSANASYPMVSSWDATNIGAGSGSYSLGPTGFNNPHPYQATTSDMTSGATYTTSEVTDNTSNVLPIDATCQPGKTRLVGYSTGATLADAATATMSSTAPNFTDLTSDEFVVVHNETCPDTTITPSPSVTMTPTPTPGAGQPTYFAQCRNNGWKTFTDPTFKTQVACLLYVTEHLGRIDGSVGYTANGLNRHAYFSAADLGNSPMGAVGAFAYTDTNHSWYEVNVTDLKVSGDTAWFAGKVNSASNHSWIGQWLFAKIVNGSPDKIWGSFTDKATAETGVMNMIDPADGPFSVTSGNLNVQ